MSQQQPPQQQYPSQQQPPMQQAYSTYPSQPQPQQQSLANPPKNLSNDDLLLYILAFFCPPLAIFWMKGGCVTEVLITLVLWFCFWFPGFIYAIYLILQRQKEIEAQNNGMV